MNVIFEDLEKLRNFITCSDINKSGLPRFCPSPLFSATNNYNVRYKISNEFHFFRSTDKIENYVIFSSVNHSPEDWTGYLGNVKSLFYYLNDKYLNDLRNKKALLVLDQSFEGYQVKWLWDFFHKECEKYNIPPSTIVYVTGNMIVEEIYEKWAMSNNIQEKIKVIGYTHFEIDISENMKKIEKYGHLSSFNEQLLYKEQNLEKIKTFACLNKRIRPNRVWFFKYLLDNNLLNKGLISMNVFERHGFNFENKVMNLNEVDSLLEKLPLLVYETPNNVLDDSVYINRFNNQVCLDTWITVISETHCSDSDETLFISEKTFKPIASNQPFIIMGGKNSLKKMRDLGFKTFDGFIDESYDDLPTHDRMKAIIESIKKIDSIDNKLEWFKSMEDIIKHNYNTLMNKTSEYPKTYLELKKYYEKIFDIKCTNTNTKILI
jgi:hypothetical protein